MPADARLDLLERAHAKLTELRDEATDGPWVADDQAPSMDGRNWLIRAEGQPGIRISAHDYGHFGNVELIVALHRTIDAQLEILAEAIRNESPGNFGAYEADFALARAILDEPEEQQ